MKYLLAFIVLAVALHAGEYRAYGVAPTGSMRPTFDEHCILITKVEKFSSLTVGKVIIYRTARPFYQDGVMYDSIVHRIYSRSSGGSIVLCQGDNNSLPDDEMITESMYVCTVVQWVTLDEYFKPEFRLPK